jgi:hypothetical protein
MILKKYPTSDRERQEAESSGSDLILGGLPAFLNCAERPVDTGGAVHLQLKPAGFGLNDA